MSKRRTKGEGTIYFSETHDRWIAQITLPNGKKKTKTAKTQKEVSDWLLETRKKLKDNMFSDSNLTLSEFMDLYMEEVASHTLRPKTQTDYLGLIRNHIKPEIGYIKLSKLRPDHLQSLYAKKLDSGLSRRTVQFLHAILHKVLNHAVKWGLVARNVSDLVDAPRPKKKTPVTWSLEQVKKFLNTAEEDRLYPLYLLAISTGMRLGELLGLHYEDINFETSQINIRHAIQYIPGEGLVLTEPKTAKSKRSITVPASTLQAIQAHCDRLNIFQGFVFRTSNDTPFSPRNVLRSFKSITAKAGLPEIRFHDLRHTCATLHLISGTNPKVVQELLGHSHISLTLETYSHVVPGLQEEAANKMDEMLDI